MHPGSSADPEGAPPAPRLRSAQRDAGELRSTAGWRIACPTLGLKLPAAPAGPFCICWVHLPAASVGWVRLPHPSTPASQNASPYFGITLADSGPGCRVPAPEYPHIAVRKERFFRPNPAFTIGPDGIGVFGDEEVDGQVVAYFRHSGGYRPA